MIGLVAIPVGLITALLIKTRVPQAQFSLSKEETGQYNQEF